MIKFVKFIVLFFFWLQAFAAPVLLSIIISFIVYSGNPNNKAIAIGIGSVGIASGVLLAEYIRRKYGLDTFFGAIYGSGKIDEESKSE